jgi:hypothetical protein
MNCIEPEAALYPMVLRWLNKEFRTSDAFIDGTSAAALFCADISQKAADEGGHWSRPDLAAIAYNRGVFTPKWDASIYSFEIKRHHGVDEAAVYEAMAHKRFAHFSYLLWQDREMPDAKSWRIVDLCRDVGVGAITVEAPNDENTYRLRAKPVRQGVSLAASDGFIAQRFPEDEKRRLLSWLSSTGWKQAGEGQETI